MARPTAAAAQLLLGQLSLVPLQLSGVGAQTGQNFELQQPQDKVSVAAGDTLTLTCTTSGDSPLGPVKWLKGWGSGNKTVYGQTGSFPRVTRVVSGSNTDFSIHISDVRPEDAGTYYCVKFSKSLGGEEVFQHGKGTEVSLHGECQPSGTLLPRTPPTAPPTLPAAGSRAAVHPPPSPRSALYLHRCRPGSQHGGCSCNALPPPPPRPLHRLLHVQEEAQRRGRQPVPGWAGSCRQLLAHPSAVLWRDPQHPQVCTHHLFCTLR
uniref:Ig-like domain-containing protein n=1 Tax=Strix occidentalis caurina TaxID=311401 RepID=A0A8D0FKN1_STROC